MTEDEVYIRFLDAVKQAGGQRAFAVLCDFSPSYINDVVHRRRQISDPILAKIGIERIVTVDYRVVDHPAESS